MEDSTFFKKLNKEELVNACEAFACDPDGTRDQLIIRLVEAGVTAADYNKMFGIPAEPEPETKPRTDVITTEALNARTTNSPESAKEANVVAGVVTQPEFPQAEQGQKFLIKMERENPLFEIAGARFTQENPYALLDSRRAEYILKNEKGFRMAYPSEAEDFYSTS